MAVDDVVERRLRQRQFVSEVLRRSGLKLGEWTASDGLLSGLVWVTGNPGRIKALFPPSAVRIIHDTESSGSGSVRTAASMIRQLLRYAGEGKVLQVRQRSKTQAGRRKWWTEYRLH